MNTARSGVIGKNIVRRVIPRAAHDVGDILVGGRERVRPSQEMLPYWRMRVLGVLGLGALVLLAGRGVYLQVSNSAAYRTQAEGNRIRLLVQYAPRGVMFDHAGKQLVHNVPTTDLVAYPAQLPTDIEEVMHVLREVFPTIPVTEFRERLANLEAGSPKPVPLLSNISHDEHLAVLARIDRLPGIGVESRAVREYEGGGIFAHILGYTGRITREEHERAPEYLLTESIGKSGLEKAYEKSLRGVHGARRVEVDAAGNVQSELSAIPAQSGTNLRLHIDAELQERLFRTLSEQLKKAGVAKGAAVALDPNSGAVRALVSIPTFDHSALARGVTPEEAAKIFSDPLQPFLDRALQGQYPPGSTFKIAIAAGALEEGVVSASTTVESTGGIRVGPWFFPDWKPGGHGRTDIVKALAESVNTFFYTAGGGVGDTRGLGIKRMTEWAKRLGFGSATRIDLPGEKGGFLPSPEWKEETKREPWYIGDTYHAAIGQGDILVTPMQLAVATAAIANGGTVYEPRVVDAFTRSDGSTIETLGPSRRASNVLHQETTELIRRGMRAAVTSGSARALSDVPVAIAGKTGTAQIGADDRTHAWFTSFAPFDRPELVLTILVEEGGGGDRVAVPVAEDIYRWHFGGRTEHPDPTSTPTGLDEDAGEE